MRRRFGVGHAVLVGIGLGAAASPVAGAPRSEMVRTQLLAHLAAGRADSARALVGAERTYVPDIVEWCLVAHARDLLGSAPDSAATHLANARDIAGLHASAFGDSFYLGLVGFLEGLAGDRLRTDARGWALYGDCKELDRTWQFPALQKALPDLLRIGSEVADPYLETRARRLEGRVLTMTGAEMERAREALEKALERARSVRDRQNDFQIRIMISLTYDMEDRIDESLKILMELVEPLRREGNWGLYLPAMKGIASCHMRRGNLDSALAWYHQGLEEARKAGSKRYQCVNLWEMGYALGLLGRGGEALRSVEEALGLARETGDKGPELGAMITLVELHAGQEHYTRALAILHEALPAAEQAGMTEAIANLYSLAGEIYRALGRPDEAIRHCEKIMTKARRVGGPRLETTVLRDLARAHLDLGRLDESIRFLDQSIRALAGVQLPVYEAASYLDLGAVHRLQGRLDLADACLSKAHALADSIGNPVLLGEVERTQAQVAASRGEEDHALALFDSSIHRGRSTGSTASLRQALVDKAEFSSARGDLRSADSLLAEAIEMVESVRGRQAGEDLRIGFLTDKKSIYAARVTVLRELGQSAAPESPEHLAAFQVAERARARTLLDVVSGTHADPGTAVDPALREQERRLAGRLSALQTELSQAVSADSWQQSRVDSLESEREKVAQEYRRRLDEIAVLSPSYAALSGQRPTLSLDEIRARVLSPDQVLLEYLVGEKESHLFLVTKDRFRLVRIPAGSDTLATRIAAFRRAAVERAERGGEIGSVLQHAKRLYALLLEPVAADVGPGQRLLVVPDGPLFHLPFGALHDGNAFVIEHHAIATSPSASLLDPRLARKRRRGARSLLAVGNPTTFREQVLLTELRGAEQWRFGELPYSEEEVRRVARRFRSARTLTGDLASEEAVKEAIGDASHVHFATHGLLDEEEPLLSGLALAQDDDEAEDGLLQTHEVLGLGLDADLVVLSACNTGLGRIAGGEGVMGISRAFLHAGARSVLLSLWEVADRATVDLMDSFYQAHLEAGMPADVALQRAQVASLSAGISVQEWAPFVLIGSAAAPAGTGGFSARVLLLAAAVLVGFLLVVVAAARRRHGWRAL